MNKYMNYVVINFGDIERISAEDCDPAEQAGIIDRTLLPVLKRGRGWADSRQSGYTSAGEINSNAASFVLYGDEDQQIAAIAVSLHQKTSSKMWNWLYFNALTPLPSNEGPPPAPWIATRYDVSLPELPPWIDWWAAHVGCALLGREGW